MSKLRIGKFKSGENYKLKGTKSGYPSIDKTHDKQYKYSQRHPFIPNMSIFDAISLMSIGYRRKNALNCFGLTLTYQELLDDANKLADSFAELGLKEGDILTVNMPNFIQAVTAFLAANKIGATVTFLNSGAAVDEVKHYLNKFSSKILINYDKDINYNQDIKAGTKVETIVTLSKDDVGYRITSPTKKSSIEGSFLDYKDLHNIGKKKKTIRNPFKGNNDALILFTSGTTGKPKAVVLTNQSILASGTYMKNSCNLSNAVGEKTLVCVPFCYPYGFATSTIMSLLCGREAILAPDLSASKISEYLKKQPNLIFGSPAMLELIKKNTPPKLDLSSIKTFISGGDFLSKEKSLEGKEFFAKHNAQVDICNGAGNAETVGASTNSVGIPIRPETVGKVLVGQDVIIIDPETMKEVKYNEEGTYYVSGKNVFKEYYDEPELTEKAKIKYNGKTYVSTGMRGYLDEDGYFTLTGRDSRFYITSSLNKVYCDRVQRILSMIDVVDSCVVVQKPDDEELFKNVAFVVLKEGVEQTQEVKDYLMSVCSDEFVDKTTDEHCQLKSYEVPAAFEFISELPRTTADKIDYASLEKIAADLDIPSDPKKTFIKN